MTTIYVVTSGEYSDYRIDGLFSTKEMAEKFITSIEYKYNRDNCSIEEYELDLFVEPLERGLSSYHVWMKRNGDLEGIEKCSLVEPFHNTIGVGDKERLSMYLFAKDEQHAAKIANEKRAQLIASGEW